MSFRVKLSLFCVIWKKGNSHGICDWFPVLFFLFPWERWGRVSKRQYDKDKMSPDFHYNLVERSRLNIWQKCWRWMRFENSKLYRRRYSKSIAADITDCDVKAATSAATEQMGLAEWFVVNQRSPNLTAITHSLSGALCPDQTNQYPVKNNTTARRIVLARRRQLARTPDFSCVYNVMSVSIISALPRLLYKTTSCHRTNWTGLNWPEVDPVTANVNWSTLCGL